MYYLTVIHPEWIALHPFTTVIRATSSPLSAWVHPRIPARGGTPGRFLGAVGGLNHPLCLALFKNCGTFK